LFLIYLFVDRFLSTMGTAEPLRHPTKEGVGILGSVLQLHTIGMHPPSRKSFS